MRLNQRATRVAYVAGFGEPPATRRLRFTIVDADGHDHEVMDDALVPAWMTDERAMGVGPDSVGNRLVSFETPTWSPSFEAQIGGNTLVAAAGIWAAHRTDPRRVYLSDGLEIAGATDPGLSDDAVWLSYLTPDVPHGSNSLVLQRRDGTLFTTPTGAVTQQVLDHDVFTPRWGSQSLAWEKVDGTARLLTSPAGVVVMLRVTGRRITKPVPVWVPAARVLFILCVLDDGEVWLGDAGSMTTTAPKGIPLGRSDGSAYAHDARPLVNAVLRHVRYDPAGNLDDRTVDATTPLVTMLRSSPSASASASPSRSASRSSSRSASPTQSSPEDPVPVHLSDAELIALAEHLETKYAAKREDGGLERGPIDTYVDVLGASRWRWDYINLRNQGLTPEQAWAEVNRRINAIEGFPPEQDPNG